MDSGIAGLWRGGGANTRPVGVITCNHALATDFLLYTQRAYHSFFLNQSETCIENLPQFWMMKIGVYNLKLLYKNTKQIIVTLPSTNSVAT
jgi:hypothetical protein